MNIDAKNLTKAIESKVDKSKWVKWKFSDLVENIVEKVVPKTCGLEDYIGLKHLDTGSLKIRRYGKCSEISGDKLKIYKGDLIFAKRNSYLKRVAIADFDAVASAHSLVLRAKPENVLPELLPFFMMSETFWTRAIEISVGSLSPTINWRVLAKQEFLLPPKEQQAELAELFWSMEEMIEKELALLDKLDILYLSIKKDYFSKENDYHVVTLGELVKIKSGDSPSKFKLNQNGSGIPFNKVADMNETTKYQKFAKEWAAPIESKIIKAGSVIFPKRGASIMTNKVRIAEQDCHVDTNIMALSINDDSVLLNEYLYYFLLFKGLYKIADTAQIPQINNIHINPYPIHLPPADIQRSLVQKLNLIMDEQNDAKCKLCVTISLKKSLINKVF